MSRRRRSPLWIGIEILLLSLSFLSCGSDEQTPPPTPGPAYSVMPQGTHPVGCIKEDGSGGCLEWIVTTSQRITPLAAAGSRMVSLECSGQSYPPYYVPELTAPAMPLGMAVHPNGRFLVMSSCGRQVQSIMVVDLQEGKVTQWMNSDYLFLGLVFSPDGKEVYISMGGLNKVNVYGFNGDTGELTSAPIRDMDVSGFAGGSCLTPDGKYLLVVSQFSGLVTIFDRQSGTRVGKAATGGNPYDVVVHPDGTKAYVSCERANRVDVFDISAPKRIRRTHSIPVERNPEGLMLNQDGSRLYVANSVGDSLSVIDTALANSVGTVDLTDSPGMEHGSSPNAVAYSAANQRLYVAQAGLNKLAVIDLASNTPLGDIPTGFYPVACKLYTNPQTGQESLIVVNARGVGTPYPGEMGHMPGNVSVIPLPQDLSSLSATVAENNAFPGKLFNINPDVPWTNPIPRERGGQTPIKHVFLVIRENKIFDYVLGCYDKANGDCSRIIGSRDPGEDDYYLKIIPNLYSLANRFALCDNYYSNAENSDQGHELLTGAMVNTYVQKLEYSHKRPVPFKMELIISPVTYPNRYYIFQNAIEQGIRFRNYGEAVGAGIDLLMLNPKYSHQSPLLVDPPWFWTYSKDTRYRGDIRRGKLQERIAEWKSKRFSGENFPQLIFMLFPDDHTFHDEAGHPSYYSMIANNDEATGRFVQWLTNSPYWEDSVAFIVQDDPQYGTDHVSLSRTFVMAVSPFARRGYVSSVRYNEANLYATIEYLLNMRPLTMYDDRAQPMYDLFDFQTDTEPYRHIPHRYPWIYNPPGTRGARAAADQDYSLPDQVDGAMLYQASMEMESRQVRGVPSRLREKAVRLWLAARRAMSEIQGSSAPTAQSSPAASAEEALDRMVACASEGRFDEFFGLLDKEYPATFDVYTKIKEEMNASIMPDDPAQVLFQQFEELRPRIVSRAGDGDHALLDVKYANGISAQLSFVREDDGWKFDQTQHMAATLRTMKDAWALQDAYKKLMREQIPSEQD